MRAYLRDARRESSLLLAPVTTILPDVKMRAIVLGSRMRTMRLTIVFCIAGDGLKVEAAVEVDDGDDVLEGEDDALDGGDMLLLEGEGNRCRGHGGGGRG
jgi:hypothetical protein